MPYRRSACCQCAGLPFLMYLTDFTEMHGFEQMRQHRRVFQNESDIVMRVDGADTVIVPPKHLCTREYSGSE